MLELWSGAVQRNHIKMKKFCKIPKSFRKWSCMSIKTPGEMAIVTSAVNAHIYIENLDNYLIPSIEHMFGNGEVFQDDNATLKLFFWNSK